MTVDINSIEKSRDADSGTEVSRETCNTRATTDLAFLALPSARYCEIYFVEAEGKAKAPNACTKPRTNNRIKKMPISGFGGGGSNRATMKIYAIPMAVEATF